MFRFIVMLVILAAPAAWAQSDTAVAAATATDPNGWVNEILIADKLVEAGYLDQAQTDYEGIIQKYPSTVAGIDRAWVGLAKVHLARGETDQAKQSLEIVLKRNSDAQSVATAKTTYRQLKDQAAAQLAQIQQQVQYLEYRNYLTPWYDLFTKLFTWLDLRSAKKQLDAAAALVQGFDPHYLIDVDLPTIAPVAATVDAATTAATGSSGSVHTAAPAVATVAATQGSGGSSGSGAATSSGSGTPATVTKASAAPADQLVDLQRGYQQAYRSLQDAITSGNQTRILEANKTYQTALEAYRKAASSAAQ